MRKKKNQLDNSVSARVEDYMRETKRDTFLYIEDMAKSFIRWHNRNRNIRSGTAQDAIRELETMRTEAAKIYMILHPEYACDKKLMQLVEHACTSCIFQILPFSTTHKP